MVDPAELFNTLDDGSGGGLAANSRVEGDPAAAQRGAIGFAFKDAAGNVVLPQLDALGRVPVTSEASGTCLYANGELAAGSLVAADITGASLTLTTSASYSKIAMKVCSLQASLFQIVHVDDVTPAVLGEAIVGPGQYSFCCELECFILTAGASGTQTLKLQGKNFRVLSSMRGSIAALEA